jgi:8-oxo-dGTP diphosphatase/2-hydroxy-dATP diphosphatase
MQNKKPDRKIITTNCLVYDHPQILLGLKKRGFAQGTWNGFGGKVQDGELLEQTARRELLEECGIVAEEMELAGILEVEYQGKGQVMEINIFHVKKFQGEPLESEEMKPQWFQIDQVPMQNMWPDDEYCFPLFTSGKKFKGKFIYDGYDKIITHTLTEVQTHA